MKKQILLIDNYDSFTYNLYQLIAGFGYQVDVYRNDAVSMNFIQSKPYTHAVISPGPGRPENAKISLEVMEYYKDKIPVLGVCLGMQMMGILYGGSIKKEIPLHGKKDKISHRNIGYHSHIPSPFKAARYNSLIVKDISTDLLEITAQNSDNLIMGLRHKKFNLLEGVQYHPESFMTQYGDIFIENFLEAKYE